MQLHDPGQCVSHDHLPSKTLLLSTSERENGHFLVSSSSIMYVESSGHILTPTTWVIALHGI